MQEINRDYEIKQQLKANVKIEITEDNLSDYFEEKPKKEIELLREENKELKERVSYAEDTLLFILNN